MWLAEIWRYPVKSMRGERLEAADLGPGGIPGDRVAHVEDARGKVVTSRSRPGLLAHAGTLGREGAPLVDGRRWDDVTVAADVVAAAGPTARLVRTAAGRFDKLPLLVATDGAIAAFGHDHRRLRPNLVIGGVEGLAERSWAGRRLAIGTAIVAIDELRERCIMTTFDPDTQEQDVAVLLGIRELFEGRLALDAEVLRPGRVSVDDAVELVP
jgi:uncharacterized protein YcbX